MSRIGNVPVTVPEKVNVKIDGVHVAVKGPKGQLEYAFSDKVGIELKDKTIVISPKGDDKKSRALWGTTRSLINNMVIGVSEGFTRVLEMNGIGYKATVKGRMLELNLGYSHPIQYEVPKGIDVKVNKNVIELSGCDKEMLGLVSAKIRSFRPPEPYKGKGIKYRDEIIVRKAGKTAVK